jgi:ADP-ribose pyrophosphatase
VRNKRFDGTWSATVKREIFERGHATAVLLYDAVRDAVVLTEQFRVGALAAGWHPWLIETVAGIVDEGETPERAAVREAQEEAGAQITESMMIKLFDVLASPGGSSETIRLFCAPVDSTTLGGFHGMVDEAEDIRVFTLPLDEAMAWIENGRINNSTTILALQWLALHHEEVRETWGAKGK